MVPYLLPRRYANSSTPSICGVGARGTGCWRKILRMVIREQAMPREALRAAAAFPPCAKPAFSKLLGASCGSSCIHTGQFREPLGKNLASTGFVLAKEAANDNDQSQGFSCAW